MKPIRFYVMEDVPSTLHEILDVLTETKECEVVGSSDHIHTGCEDILSLQPDALLLDITLNGGTAFELIQKLKHHQFPLPPVVIMTGDPSYEAAQEAVDILGTSLIKLLEKPFWKNWPSEFQEIKTGILARMAQSRTESPDLIMRKTDGEVDLFVRSSHMTYRIVVSRILYLEAEAGFTTFVCLNDKRVKIRKTLNEILTSLPDFICRIGRNHAVNLHWLDQIDHETNELFLEGCKENFFIGEPYKANLKAALGI